MQTGDQFFPPLEETWGCEWRPFPKDFIIEKMIWDGVPVDSANEIYNRGARFTVVHEIGCDLVVAANDDDGDRWWFMIELIKRIL